MTETQKQIKQLKSSLPSIKERVVAVAVLLALSLTMVLSVSYAWVTLSRKPELGGVHTTLSSNGNLEIALSDFDGKEPDSSGIADSFSAEGQTTHGANTKWGNLINLTAGYGLEELILRPAVLDTQSAALLTGVKYGEDGRVEGAATDFAFTSWMLKDQQTQTYAFMVPKKDTFGVRAISSVGFPDGKSEMQQKLDRAQELHRESFMAYNTIMSNPAYIAAIESIVQVYLDANISSFLNGGDEVDTDCTKFVSDVCGIMEDFYNNAICKYGDTLAYMADIQQSLKNGNDYVSYNRDTLIAATAAELTENGVNLSNSLAKYKTLEAQVKADMITLQGYRKEVEESYATIYWSDLETIINNLIDINTVTVQGKTAGQIVSSGARGALQFLNSLTNPTPIVVKKGALKNFEVLSGNRMDVDIKFKILGTTYNGNMKTNLTSTDSSMFSLDMKATEDMSASGGNKGNMVAEDTYGMVLDLWFRTNSAGPDGNGTVLTLDGLPEIETYSEQRMIILSGETQARPVYIYNRPTGGELSGVQMTEEVLVYKDDDGNYYHCTTYEPVYIAEVVQQTETDESGETKTYNVVVDTDTPISDADVSPKMDVKEKVVGFASSNRIWKDGELVLDGGEISATQGSGSCYVFYANTPEESASALELLSHLKLAFMDASGNLLAQAEMDVEHVFAENGKYIVPLVVKQSDYVTTNTAGETIFGVTNLMKNVATRISVVVYLDGEGLENSMVMSAEDILGSLNLQFSTTEDIRALGDSALAMDTIALRADISNDNFTYNGSAQTANLTAYVEGLTPAKVQAVFQRRINATQGKQMPPVTLTNSSGGIWNATCSFTTPGTYVLNSLLVDGVEYPLPESERITVNVSGFAIASVGFCEAAGENLAMTAERSVQRDVTVSFDADVDSQPSTVEARFATADGHTVSTKLTFSGGFWNGTANFTSSGTYTLQYLVLDGEYFELDEALRKEFTAYVGLRTKVYLQREGGLTFDYTGPQNVTVMAEILTDNDQTLKGLENVRVQYQKRGSSILAQGLSADLTWNEGMYRGTFNVDKVGVFTFAQLQVGGNVITNAISAPSVTSRSVEPPKYEGTISPYLMVHYENAHAYYEAQISNATGADNIVVVFTDANGLNYEVNMSGSDGDVYLFEIPNNMSGNKNGVWTITEIRLYGVYDQNGKYYGYGEDGKADTYYTLEPNANDVFTVVDEFHVTMDKLTLNNNAVFMTEQTLTGENGFGAIINLVGVELPDSLAISNVKLTLKHNMNTSNTYGGYSYSDASNAEATKTFTLTKNAAGKWVVSADAAVRLAGTYDYVLTFDLSGDGFLPKSFSFSSDASKAGDEVLTVHSLAPTVAITAVSPTVGSSINVDTGTNANSTHTSKTVPSFTSENATVYIKCERVGSGTTCQPYIHNYTAPNVTITLSGICDGSTASLSFGSSAGVYNGSTMTGSYEWTANGTCERTIGSGEAKWSQSNKKTPAGTITAETLTVVYGSVTYTVTIPTITINNPY